MAKRNIESWLTDLGLADHARVFADNRIDFDVLAIWAKIICGNWAWPLATAND